MNSSRVFSMIVGVLTVSFTAAVAQMAAPAGYDLSWNTVDGGGGISTGGTFELSGTVGQPDASMIPMTGGTFEVSGGFWPGSAAPAPECVGDVNHNGVVNIDDLVLVITHWGQAGGQGDVNHNNIINIDDLVQVMDAVRIVEQKQNGTTVQAELFPNVSIGDAPATDAPPAAAAGARP